MRTVADLVTAEQARALPAFVFFWGNQPLPGGRIGPSCLSQWWPAPFVVDGISYATTEHYMMWRKATLFGDDQAAATVLRAAHPADAKACGRAVVGFSTEVWARHRFDAVVDGNRAKFGQDDALRRYLIGTGEQVLVEASPVDAIWGIGLAADHRDARVPSRWQGLNLLGFALMTVRTQLRAPR